ncbi:AraC family transcriptional regulator [Rhodoplanes sp. TEM]|uniref:AraC family transcriptional regulator n=1 Tax=Rhodoplanes tepidamans TaxID=200616 RepID=A0ABT5JDS0_RHOTP|nr:MULTISPECIES: AraC family transcriptional regulator [Rhodoplanes]MDC7787672.1 AraC family transcriptional regulator [Rhodoplanes tepidamans]MDC7985940.1 AraC family transcriptional regulator [Rhodoplanes sp. TEM]MDQ0355244.1 AraC-like DNA-binding protein [Rhodoplanes tepidamans]
MQAPAPLAAATGSLAGLIDRYSDGDGIHPTAVPRLVLIRSSRPTEPLHALHAPAVCIVAQGRKQVIVGDRVLHYGPGRYLAVSVEVPIVGQVTEASPEAPYLCVRLDLDPAALGGLMLDAGIAATAAARAAGPPAPALAVSAVTPALIDAAVRLVQLLETPAEIPILAPLVERELLYRLLRGEQASALGQIAHGESRLQQVNRAIGWIKRNFREPFRIERLAEEARMSPSTLHEHFKAVTAMSPLQYQKQLRLQEARRLILSQAADAASAGHAVGYDSPSQFSREYRRLFGLPPLRDAARLRDSALPLQPL